MGVRPWTPEPDAESWTPVGFVRYGPRYRSGCLALFDANCPTHFAPNEREDYDAFLKLAGDRYFVRMEAGEIVAAFGLLVDGTARRRRLTWIMVHPERHSGGLGKAIMTAVLARSETLGLSALDIAASHLSAPFFARFGAVEVARTPDGWGSEMDRIDMQLPITGGLSLVVSETPSEEDREAVVAPLRAYNEVYAGPANPEQLAILLKDAEGAKVGGLWGKFAYDWLFVEYLAVPQGSRFRGYGAALMKQAEQAARARRCVGIWLDTFSFQARGFYERLGYTSFGIIDDHPKGHQCFFLLKRLVEPVHHETTTGAIE